MSSLVLQPTDLAQWHALVSEAQAACEHHLDETIESYLVFLLMRFVERPELAQKIIALEFLEAQRASGQQTDILRDVGDQCLLFSGLFPKIAERRMVQVSYFVHIGRTAYDQLGTLVDHKCERMFSRLADGFVRVMDVLQAMRGLSGQPVLDPLTAAELWAETGSQSAYREIVRQSDGLPVPTDRDNKRPH
jgi:hypothetical protein